MISSMNNTNGNYTYSHDAHPNPQLNQVQPIASVLVVDDDAGVLYITSKILSRHHYQVKTISSAEEALKLVQQENFDLVVSDIAMPGMNGLEFLEALKRRNPLITSVVITGSGTAAMAVRAIKSGAQGFVPKPFTEHELIESIQIAMYEARTVRENMAMKLYMPLLEKTNSALIKAMEAKDQESHGHSQQVADLVLRIVSDMGMSEELQTQCYFGALFHDVGKIGISDAILNKREPLTAEEEREMMRHPEIGAHIISTTKDMAEATLVIRHHHEWYDGTGYPDKLKGEEIPFVARLVTIADVYEEIKRSQPQWSQSQILSEMRYRKGTQLDPELTERVIAVITEPSLLLVEQQ